MRNDPPRKKNPHAVALGRIGGKARLIKMTAEQRRAVSRLGNEVRWGKRKPKAKAAP
jgi:hypothetical protein